MYGTGKNEELVGRAIKGRRERYLIASKFGNVLTPGSALTTASRWAKIAHPTVRRASGIVGWAAWLPTMAHQSSFMRS
jgi:aryl-alcohol dehydrogenase-like predicted oxidoreductase